ncbi:hypothetical protein ACQPYK_29310 [Streptosporangium sp. CA-135522]|uniref:hypothetical protein n=1 Tax=Streptosporangium sp. CA-135522 TaxID=3240072 RepID=UPI003D8B5F19
MGRVPDPGELSREEIETELAAIKHYADSRDGIVRAAHAAGMNPHQIHKRSGIGRTTVYRISKSIAHPLNWGVATTARRRAETTGALYVSATLGTLSFEWPATSHSRPGKHTAGWIVLAFEHVDTPRPVRPRVHKF